MFRIFLVSCLVLAIQGASLPNNRGEAIRRHQHLRPIFPNGKIVGGAKVDITEVPWQVALEDTGYLFCGGSIISGNFVLTAAHCTDGTPARYISVRSGTSKLESGGSVSKVQSIAQNPKFDISELDFDVSVLNLTTPIELSDSAQPVSLRSEEAKEGETARVTGWGTKSSSGGSLPPNLQAVNVPIVDRKTCKAAYDADIAVTARMICAGEAGKDSCQGDSGGAITVDEAQVGIVSWGYGCGEPGYPGVYSNVAALKDFINENSNNETSWV